MRSWHRTLVAAAGLCFVAVETGHAATPALDYMLHCRGCHLADGTGSPGAVPSLAGIVGKFLSVPGGREYLVRVPGSAQSALTDASLAGVLNWMIREFGPAAVSRDFVPFDAEEVSRYRDPPLTDVEDLRRELLRRIEQVEAGRPR